MSAGTDMQAAITGLGADATNLAAHILNLQTAHSAALTAGRPDGHLETVAALSPTLVLEDFFRHLWGLLPNDLGLRVLEAAHRAMSTQPDKSGLFATTTNTKIGAHVS
jgi:hypothetical protein